MDIFTIILVFGLGWYIGNRYLVMKLRNAVQEEMERMGLSFDASEDDSNQGYPTLFTESTQGVILVYDRDTSDFVCQGNTLEEAASKSKIKRAKVEHNEELYYFVDGKVTSVAQ